MERDCILDSLGSPLLREHSSQQSADTASKPRIVRRDVLPPDQRLVIRVDKHVVCCTRPCAENRRGDGTPHPGVLLFTHRYGVAAARILGLWHARIMQLAAAESAFIVLGSVPLLERTEQ
jgi:hypothetical protein